MQEAAIRPAETSDLASIEAALKALAQDLDDPYHAEPASLRQALFGAPASAWSQVAGDRQKLHGIVLFSPAFSTVQGGAGVYVSDLWVDDARRGSGLGRALLQSAAETAETLWGARFMRLAVYSDNTRARTLYDELGFEPVEHETVMALTGRAFQNMKGQR